MNIFLGAELYGKADHLWFELRKEFNNRIKTLDGCSYGDELNDIAIISIIMPEGDLLDSYPERKLFKRKTKEADIRLRIDYKEFILAKPEKRAEIYADHILLSVKTLEKKVSKKFNFIQLMRDLKTLLPESTIEV